MPAPLNAEILNDVVRHLIIGTVDTHDEAVPDGQTWNETYEAVMYWDDREGFTTQTVYEMPQFGCAKLETARRYAHEAMRVIHAMGETAARELAATVTA